MKENQKKKGIISLQHGMEKLGLYYCNGWNKLSADDDKYELESSCIIAWMPLPEPYKAGEEE